MRIVIQPQTDKYCDKLLDATVAMARAIKNKHPAVPSMEITLESAPGAGTCNHEFKIVDISFELIMIRCQKCQRVYRVEYSREEVMRLAG